MPFSITLRIGANQELSGVDVSGSEIHKITDQEKKSFGLTDDVLKQLAKASLSPRNLQGFWLDDPTPSGRYGGNNLFSLLSMLPASVTVTAVSAEIVSFTTEPTIMSTKDFDNNSDVEAEFDAKISEEVEESASSSWSQENEIDVSETIDVSVKVFGIGADSSTSFGYSHKWGEAGETSHKKTVGSESSVKVTLKPGEHVKAELTATRGSFTALVHYAAQLSGGIMVLDDQNYGGISPFADLVAAGKMPTVINITETVSVGYYAGGTVKLESASVAALVKPGSRLRLG